MRTSTFSENNFETTEKFFQNIFFEEKSFSEKCTMSYRFGFNGQEKDEELGSGIQTAEYWEYDSRLGRRWNTDPVITHWESSYAVFNNNPIKVIDLNGKFPEPTGNTNTVTSIVKNRDGSYLVSETTVIRAEPIMTTTIIAQNSVMGTKTYSTTTSQQTTTIKSMTIIDAKGNVIGNNAVQTISETSNSTQTTFGNDGFAVGFPTFTSSLTTTSVPTIGNFIGPLAVTTQQTLQLYKEFPLKDDEEVLNALENGTYSTLGENAGPISKAMEGIGNKGSSEKEAPVYTATHNLVVHTMHGNQFTMTTNKKLVEGDFKRHNYSQYTSNVSQVSAKSFTKKTTL